MNTDSYIDLHRRFVPFDDASVGERDDHNFLTAWYSGSNSWDDVLGNRCTVIIAEGGAGKTRELRHQVEKLRAEDRQAFFCRLEALATMSFEESLEIGTASEFDAWQKSSESGFFFLDSVDEARLTRLQDFEVAIAHFVKAVAPHKDRITTVISTRPHAWQAYTDQNMLVRRLGLAPTPNKFSQAEESNEEPEFGEVASGQGVQHHSAPETSPILIVQMAPLDREQVRIFAQARGITDVDSFLDAIERADADVFATRPADLPALIDVWKRENRIGRYSDVVADNIRLKLIEANGTHAHAAPIAYDRAMDGAITLAAAATLTRRTSILVPGRLVSEAVVKVSLNPELVLKGWTSSEITALLSRALFDEAQFGAVRLHHRTAREYLTAQWFERLLGQRKSRRAIEALFFAKPYGTEREIVIPSMKPVVGWLAIVDQRIRDTTLRIDPKVLLEFGDASALDLGTRESLLKGFAARYATQKHTPMSLDVRVVRRLAEPKLSVLIRALLKDHRDHVDVRQLLLRMIREGRIAGCGSTAVTFAIDATMDAYTRSVAVQAVGASGAEREKRQLAQLIRDEASSVDRQVAAAALAALWPDAMTDADVIDILRQIGASKPYSSDHLENELERLAGRLTDDRRVHEMLKAVVNLLQQPPLHSNHCRISKQYDWLLQFAWPLVQRLLKAGYSATDCTLVRAIWLCEQADHIGRYTGDVRKEALALLEVGAELRHAVFWEEVEQVRAHSSKPITDLWQAARNPVTSSVDETDIDHFLDALQQRALKDDKLVALSVLNFIYERCGRKAELLEKIQSAVHGHPDLEVALAEHLKPRPPSKEMKEYERGHRARERKRKAEEQKNAEARKNWIARLQENPSQVGNLDIVAEGKIWNNTIWLFNEMRQKRKDSARWTLANWDALETDFGRDVAVNFRDFCIAAWRRYTPALRSEGDREQTSTPWIVIIGLSGLTMEAQAGAGWATKLTSEEAKLATRYALWELNEFPRWLSDVYQAYSREVAAVLLGEIKWEFDQTSSEGTISYVLSRLQWSGNALGQALRDQIFTSIQAHPNSDPRALLAALRIVLREPAPLPTSFKAFISKRAKEKVDDAHRAVWTSALLCIDSEDALRILEKWVESAPNPTQKEERTSRVLNLLWGDGSGALRSYHQDFMKAGVLLRLLKLSHSHVRLEDDIEHDEAYTPEVRDYSQRARDHLLSLLYQMPGRSTYDALLDLSRFHKRDYDRDNMLILAERRAEADAEGQQSAWSDLQIGSFSDEVERQPANERELFELASSRLDDLKIDLEEGDESEAAILRRVKDEVELRRSIANRLKHAAQGKYTTGSEEELADKTRTDIRLHNPNVETRIPIEIKIAGQWQTSKLCERLKNQLVGQYMLEANFGIFLVVNRGAERDLKSWKVSKKASAFSDLLRWLQLQAKELATANSRKVCVEVVGIDLTKRDAAAIRRRKVTKAKRAATTKSTKTAATKAKGSARRVKGRTASKRK